MKEKSMQFHTKNKEFLKYCSYSCQMAKLFRNSVIFRCRQLISAHYKLQEGKALSDNEKQVIDEIKLIAGKYPQFNEKVPFGLSYNQFDYLFLN